MQYVRCDVWYGICDNPDLIFCKSLSLWVKGIAKLLHMGVFKGFWLTIRSGRHMCAKNCKSSPLAKKIVKILPLLLYGKSTSSVFCLLLSVDFIPPKGITFDPLHIKKILKNTNILNLPRWPNIPHITLNGPKLLHIT